MPHAAMTLSQAITALTLCALSFSASLNAAEVAPLDRRFAYTYPSLTAPVGEIELENWATWKSRPGSLRTFEFRHEIEYGLTAHTQVGLNPANWTYDARARGSTYNDTSIEVIHNLTNPVTDLFGSALYGEVAMGDRHAGIEGKLILEKRFGKWVAGWNGALEAETEGTRFGDFQESNGELNQSAGISCDLTQSLSLGAELVHKMPLVKWHGPENSEVYAGPNIAFHKSHFKVIVATLFQTTNRSEQPAFQLRTIIGIEF